MRDLYALYPDYAIDVAAEQAALAAAHLMVWLHPIQWYGMPALQKLWLDEVLAYGWAYGPGGTACRQGPVAGDTTGGAEASYHPTATTAISSTPSCRPTSRPRRCAACASCRRWCCTARTRRRRGRARGRTPRSYVERLRQLSGLARARRADAVPDVRGAADGAADASASPNEAA